VKSTKNNFLEEQDSRGGKGGGDCSGKMVLGSTFEDPNLRMPETRLSPERWDTIDNILEINILE